MSEHQKAGKHGWLALSFAVAISLAPATASAQRTGGGGSYTPQQNWSAPSQSGRGDGGHHQDRGSWGGSREGRDGRDGRDGDRYGHRDGRGEFPGRGYGWRGHGEFPGRGYGWRDGRGEGPGRWGHAGYGHGYGYGYGRGGYGHGGYGGYPSYYGWARGGLYSPAGAIILPAYRGWGYYAAPVVIVAPAYHGWAYR